MDNIFNRIHENFFNNPYKNLTQTELNDKLLEASKTGNLSEVTALLRHGADIKATNKFGINALIFACKKGHTGTAEWLIKNGAEINAKDRAGYNALIFACMKGHIGIAELLIKNGADIKATNRLGDNALMSACWNGQTGTANFLLQHGADINATDGIGCNALLRVCLKSHIDTAYLLLDRMTPEEREAFANLSNDHLKLDNNFKENLVKLVNNFKESLGENVLSVFEPWKKVDEENFSIFELLPFELRCIISGFSAQLKFKDSWYRFSALKYMNLAIERCDPVIKDKLIFPVLFLANQGKARGEPENPNIEQKMEIDEEHESITFSKNN